MSDTDTLIRKELLTRIEEKKKIIDSKRPLPSSVVNKLREDIRLQHTYHSNAIEGNTLTLQETKLVLEEGMTIGGKSLREHLEATNSAEGFDFIERIARKNQAIGSFIIQQVHEIVVKGILEDAGKYRIKNVRITGAKKTPPDFSKTPVLIEKLIQEIKNSKKNPVEIAAYLHYKLVEIHPFSDGNGRVARLLTNLYLIQKGYPPIVLKKENRSKYYKYLRSADAGNFSPFTNFIAKAVDEALTQHLSVFGGRDELMPLKELAKSSPYSQEYLSLRARQGHLDAVKIGKAWHSSKRALEEYIKQHRKHKK
jgi:Fic family protein